MHSDPLAVFVPEMRVGLAVLLDQTYNTANNDLDDNVLSTRGMPWHVSISCGTCCCSVRARQSRRDSPSPSSAQNHTRCVCLMECWCWEAGHWFSSLYSPFLLSADVLILKNSRRRVANRVIGTLINWTSFTRITQACLINLWWRFVVSTDTPT